MWFILHLIALCGRQQETHKQQLWLKSSAARILWRERHSSWYLPVGKTFGWTVWRKDRTKEAKNSTLLCLSAGSRYEGRVRFWWVSPAGQIWATLSPSSTAPITALNDAALPLHLQLLVFSHNPMFTKSEQTGWCSAGVWLHLKLRGRQKQEVGIGEGTYKQVKQFREGFYLKQFPCHHGKNAAIFQTTNDNYIQNRVPFQLPFCNSLL